ncbi:amidohydrolase family protein [Candidatus Zixiibacteriota bacterium]
MKGMLIILTVLILGGTFSCGRSQAPSGNHNVIALINGLLIDGTGADPLSPATVIVQDRHIDQVGRSSEVSIPQDATVIDLQGATILPGFFNAHVHNAFSESKLKTWAREGVTTVRDLGANPNWSLSSMRDELMADHQNARLVFAGPLVTVPNGYPIDPWGSSAALPCTSVADAQQKINELLDNGADVIKIALERGDIWQRNIPVLTPEMAAAICSVAHHRGTVVSAHIIAARDIDLILAAGVDDLAHMAVTTVTDEQINRLVNDSIYWVPTLELWHGSGPTFLNRAISNLSRFFIAGGMVALGTDFEGYTTPFELGMPLREIGFMADAGMEPLQIIVAATKNAAIVCNLGDELGTIEPGKIADLLIVNGNPLEDLPDALTDVRMVIHNGVIIVDNDN